MILRSVVLFVISAAMAFAGSLDQAKSLMDERKYEDARPLLEKALKDPSTEAEASLLLTRTCNALADWKAGVKVGKRAVKLLPRSSEAHYEYAVALRLKMSNVGRVKAMFTVGPYKEELKQALELDPKNTAAIGERIGFLTNAPSVAGGDLDEAEREVARLEKLDWLFAKEMQVAIETRREDIPAAMRVIEEILERHPDRDSTRIRLGYLLQQNEQYEEADELFAGLQESEDRTLALTALYQRGRTRVLGSYELEEAVGLFERYIEELGERLPGVPDETAARWRMGMAYEGMAETDKARAAYERALELAPDYEPAKKALKNLK